MLKTKGMKQIISENAPAAIGPYSQAVEVGGFVYASAQLPIDPAKAAAADAGEFYATDHSAFEDAIAALK